MTPSEDRKRHRILVVDDDDTCRDLVQRYLRAEHDVMTVENGSAALETLEKQAVDLVLLDVILPGIGGNEVCRRIKSMRQDTYLPVLLVTSLDAQEDRNEGLMSGADDFLTKPFDRHELRLRVNTFLRLRDMDRTIRSQVGELQKLQRLKDDLIGLIVHDVRNPLAGIEGHLELLQRDTSVPEFSALAPRVEKLRGSANALRGILDGLLEVRVLEEDQLPLRFEPTRIANVIEDAVATVEGAGLAKSVSVHVTVVGELVAGIDRRLVTRAVANLLSNAIRHSPRGTGVEIRATGDGHEIAVEIADRGEGVPDGMKDELFRKFRSFEAGSGGRRRGYGLGLYLVKLVADAHDGGVSIADRGGGGAAFTLTLRSQVEPR